jgi:hypothetical protein
VSSVRGAPRSHAALTALAVALTGALLLACRGGSSANDLPDAGVSPQAKAEPAQLENVAVSSAQAPAPGAGPPPAPLRSDEEVASDPIAKELPVWEIEGALRTFDIPPAFRGPETAIAAIDAVKKRTEPRLTIDLTPARLRIRLASAGFLLPQDTELRGRSDFYGHFLLLPNERQYRIVASGALRALLGERRIDVEPLVPAVQFERGEGARRLGYRTRRVEVTNRAATATFELARIPEAGEGGSLLCRAFLDLMNAPPSTPACGADEVPLHVDWRWATKGGLSFEATTLAHRADVAAIAMEAPPPGLAFASPSLPESGGAAPLVDQGDLVAFRTAPADLPLSPSPAPRSAPLPRSLDASAPSGLTLANGSDEMRVAWLDGAPIAWIAPGGTVAFPSLFRGRYGFAWRTFLGDAYDAPITITVPVTLSASAGDAGAP